MQNRYQRDLLVGIFLLALFCTSCKKYLEINPPPDQVVTDNVFVNDQTAISAINGIYSEMMNNSSQFCNGAVTLYAGMSSDELKYFQPDVRTEFAKNDITVANHPTLSTVFWAPAYKYIYTANMCLEKLMTSNSITPTLKKRLIGECKFIRAFCYFHLTNLFGDVPLCLDTDYRKNEQLPRSKTKDILVQIEKDLIDAESLLDNNYALQDRSTPNRMSAAALLSKLYLYQKNWSEAEEEANKVINSGLYFLSSNVTDVFLKESKETIWQLAPVAPSRNTWEGFMILPSSNSSVPTYVVTEELLSAFEMGDRRKLAWIKARSYSGQTIHHPYKYRVRTGTIVSEFYIVFRLAELYLIRAEARANQDNIAGAVDDLNQIRSRASLTPLLNNIDKTACLSSIEKERRLELLVEWGNRWYDLKRTDRVNKVIGSLKPASWQPTDALWPIPIDQMKLNSSLVQNPGY